MSLDFERLMLPHLDAAYRLAVAMVRDEAAAQDIVQDSYLKAWRSWWRFIPGNEKAWLLTIVRRRALTWLKGVRHGEVAADDEDLTAADQAHLSVAADQEAAIIAGQSGLRVRAALARLAAPLREVIVLRDFEDMAYKDIARVLEVPVGTVMSRLARGRESLRAILVKDGHGGM
ncbi:MAG: sigma-70 family RNA polymerase sigma factor [Asticcacaulis sp.]